jgi:thiol-disulfide isomerase/thioredoxin
MTNATRVKQRQGHHGKVQRRESERRKARQRNLVLGLTGVVAVVVVAALVLSSGGTTPDTPPSKPGEVSIDRTAGPLLGAGDLVPGFSAPALGGGRIEWSSFAGKPTVLAIWAPWCPHCQAELPRLSAALQGHPNLQLATVATAIGREPGSVEGYLRSKGLSFPVAIDDSNDTILQGLGVSSFPTVFYVGSDGKVVDVTTGEIAPDQLSALLTKLEGA